MAERLELSLPMQLPSVETALSLYLEMLSTPQEILENFSLKELLTFSFDVSKAWLIGSRAWSIVLLGRQAESTKDFDIVFAEPGAAEEFSAHAYERLTSRNPDKGYIRERNRMDGWKIRLPPDVPPTVEAAKLNQIFPYDDIPYGSGQGVMDVWQLPEDTSIAEHIMGFKHQHERVAILLGACAGEYNAITRLARPQRYNPMTNPREAISYGS